jgi:mannose-6-phosphate isomerase-like protein (cupin superfamily)
MRTIAKPWGSELVWAESAKYLGKILRIQAGKRLSLQYHKIKDETIMVLTGTLQLDVGPTKNDLKTIIMHPGQTYWIQPGVVHRMSGVTDVEVVEVSTSEILDVVRLEDDFGRVK